MSSVMRHFWLQQLSKHKEIKGEELTGTDIK